ncbi:DUF4747 family protein [Pantoea agglomerans]|uniref:DUF4747 family protein n=1 Tax=Enterobacter agglomerans TaxID=549 RepID=A0A7X2SUB2_ENTAG|nr:DUF4747 family protein [Pantoea agglomerans]
MASFIFFNIQLLPNESSAEVGVRGYKKLFQHLKERNISEIRSKNHLSYHFNFGKNSYIGPYEFYPEPGGVNGNFIKYNETDDVTELLTDKLLFERSKQRSAVSGKKKIPFIFDAKDHILAIDQNAAPSNNYQKLTELLTYFLQEIATKEFPNHSLTINMLSLPSALESVFTEAIAYKSVDVDLYAPNGDDAENILDEMKQSKMQKLKINGSTDEGYMLSVPPFVKKIIKFAQTHGRIKMRYKVRLENSQETKMISYDSENSPLKLNIRHSKSDESDKTFLISCSRKIKKFLKTKENVLQEDEIV